MMSDNQGPWGNKGNDGDGRKDPAEGSGSPWLPPSGGRQRPERPRRPSGFDDMLRRGPFGPGIPQFPGGQRLWLWIGIGVLVLWVALTSVHRLDPEEEGVVTRFGSYSRTLGPGLQFTLPLPLENIQKVPVRQIRTEDIPSGSTQNLVLTGDANIINLAYTVRWTVKHPERFVFQLQDARGTIRAAAESAMRATIANFTLAQAIGSGRTDIEGQVQERMQTILDTYGSGVQVAGIAIRDSVPPTEVEEAFNNVNAAKQRSESFLNEARAYAEQVQRRAEGEAAQFDRIYEQYALAPDVTRRRIYYETMERVLSRSEKTVVDSRGVVPYMALPEARRRAQQAAETPQPPAPAQGGGQ